MTLAEFFVKIGIDDQTTSKMQSITHTIGSGLASASKVGVAAVGAAATAVAGLTTKSVQAYGDFQQLVGGVETLFGTGGQTLTEYVLSVGELTTEVVAAYRQMESTQNIVFANAQKAYKTAGMSANEYMETVASFSAALINGLGGDTEEAARYADIAIKDMADNANKMGTSLEAVQVAYAGFAKGNYTMLDNLKLGFGGTASEMIRLLNASGLWEEEIKSLDGVTMDNIIAAIHQVQVNMGITGTTASEAEKTIQGSLASLKSAWENVLAAMGGGTSSFTLDFETQLDNLIDSAEIFYKNIEPVILQAVSGIGKGIERIVPMIADKLPTMIESLLPAAVTSVTALIQGASGVIPTIVNTLVKSAPEIIKAGFDVIGALAIGIQSAFGTLADKIVEQLPTLIPAAINVILGLLEYITDPNNLLEIINTGFMILSAFADGIVNAVPDLVSRVPAIIINLAAALVQGSEQILASGVMLITKFFDGVFTKLASMDLHQIFDTVKDTFTNVVDSAENWGADLINNFVSGIKENVSHLFDSMKEVAEGIWSYIHFSEPEKGPLSNFSTYAPDMMKTFAEGIKANTHLVTDQIQKSFDFGDSLTAEVGAYRSNNGTASMSASEPITIVVQSVLDGNIIGETAYKYSRQKERAYGV